MHSGPARSTAARSLVLAVALFAGGCGHLPPLPTVHWPWQHRPPPPVAPVHELDISGAGSGDAFAQRWKRNTLLLDLRSASGSGSIVLKPVEGGAWPVRLAFTVTPGAIGVLEVRADQRVTIPIAPSGAPIDLELTPRVYTARTAQMTLTWAPLVPPAP